MIRIGVISDTHLSHPTKELRDLADGPFKEVEMILHAGDMTELRVLDSFSGKKVVAVCGNMDSSMVRKEFPPERVLGLGDYRIGLIHGWGMPQGIEERIARQFEGVDCIVYGHTHHPSARKQEGIFFFNPGAFGGLTPRTVGLLTLGEEIEAEIIYL